MDNGEFRTRKEACWAIANLTTGGTRDQTLYAVQQGCIPSLVNMLSSHDTKIVQVALDGLSNILRAGVRADGANPCADVVEECGGVDIIEQLQTHENDDVYRKSQAIIEHYFSPEEEEDNSLAPAATSTAFAFAPTPGLAITTGGFTF